MFGAIECDKMTWDQIINCGCWNIEKPIFEFSSPEKFDPGPATLRSKPT